MNQSQNKKAMDLEVAILQGSGQAVRDLVESEVAAN